MCANKKPPAYNKGKAKAFAWLRAHVNYQGDDCLIWPFSLVNGYGALGVDGDHYYAHVLMCELVNGPAPPDKPITRHTCGNGHLACVHPQHVKWGTYSRNQLDRAIHGTRNEFGGRGNLTPDERMQIVELRGKMLQREIAKIFNTTRSTVSNIQCGRWGNVPLKGYAKDGNRFRARIIVNKKTIWLGVFDTAAKAHAAYVAESAKVRAKIRNKNSLD